MLDRRLLRLIIDNFDDMPGGMTTIDLWVFGKQALVRVNGRFRVPLDLVHPAVSSGIAVGTGFDPGARQPGREIGVQDFTVWR